MNDKSKKALRKRLYINHSVQGALLLRSVLHWFFYMCATLLAVVIWTVLRNPEQPAISLIFEAFVYFSPAILASLFILPLFLYDCLKETNRIVGPIHRLQNEMKKLTDTKCVNGLRFRGGDHWAELAEEFNRLAHLVSHSDAPYESDAKENDEKQEAESELVNA